MGGNIALESVPGQGTTFRFDLQLPPWSESDTESESNADEVLPPHRSPSDNPVILIAEDMAVNMVLVRTLVEQSVEGVEILQAENGMQVLELLRRHRPDLVLMDVQMPQLDGLLATRGIREMEQGTGRRHPHCGLIGRRHGRRKKTVVSMPAWTTFFAQASGACGLAGYTETLRRLTNR